MEGFDLLISSDDKKLAQFQYNSALDAKEKVYRISNDVIGSLISMQAPSWRMFESIAKHIDVYPIGIKSNKEFIEALEQGRRYVPAEYRTVTLLAADYIADYQLSVSSGRKQFVKDAISLFDETVEFFQGDTLKVSRPLSEIDFHIERKGAGHTGTQVASYAEMVRADPVASQAARITFELNERLALAMLFVVRNFTRLDSNIKSRLTPVANKLYTFLKMKMDAEKSYQEQHLISWELATWNKFLNTKYTSISRLADSFKFHLQLTEKTDLTVIAGVDKEKKTGRAYTHFYVAFMKTPAHELVEQKTLVLKPKRKRLPNRPKVLAGSHAEGVWARKCLKILRDFEKELNAIGRVLPKGDRDRMARYRKTIGEQD